MRATTTASDAAAPLAPELLAPLPREVDEGRADRLAPGLWCLRVPLPYDRPRFVNCYLLSRGTGFVLVDCGPSAGVAWEGLRHVLALAGARPEQVHELVLTHLHADHGSLAETVIARTGCRLLRGRGPDTLYDALRDPVLPLAGRRVRARAEGIPAADVAAMIEVPLAYDAPAVRPTPDRVLDPGDALVTDEATWRVVPVPGHSPGQIALFDAEHRRLLSADVAYGEGDPYLEWGHTPDPLTESLASIERVRALDPILLLAGHGRPEHAPTARLDAARDATLALLPRHRAELSTAEARSAYEVTCRLVGDDPDPDVRGSTLSVALAVLEHLAGIGQAHAERGDDGVRRWVLAG